MSTKSVPTKYHQSRNRVLAFLIRWWSTGAVYFFVGWGTLLGSRESVLDLVFFLGLSLGIVEAGMVNPVLRMAFGISSRKPLHKSTSVERIRHVMGDIVLALGIVVVVMAVYHGINLTAVSVFGFPEDKVFLPGEPLLFGLFYALLKSVFLLLVQQMRRMRGKT